MTRTRAAATVLIPVLVMGGCTTTRSERMAEAKETPKCGETVVTDALPEWARTGFSDDGAGIPHVFGKSGDILGVIFGSPLKAPPAEDHGNKILWVTRVPATTTGDLTISAKLDATGETAERKVTGGPGPSIIDLPKAGCWRLTLAWWGHTDTMDLTYSS